MYARILPDFLRFILQFLMFVTYGKNLDASAGPFPQAVRELFSAFLFSCRFERSEKSVNASGCIQTPIAACFIPPSS